MKKIVPDPPPPQPQRQNDNLFDLVLLNARSRVRAILLRIPCTSGGREQ
ncbi:hypothetical protein ACIP1T_22605 [Pseudomonas japonica]